MRKTAKYYYETWTFKPGERDTRKRITKKEALRLVAEVGKSFNDQKSDQDICLRVNKKTGRNEVVVRIFRDASFELECTE